MTKKIKIILVLVLAFIAIFALTFNYRYNYTYSEGYRSGTIQKFSHKGTIFKTYEGILNPNQFNSSDKEWKFSVLEDSVVSKLEGIEGQKVILHYKEKNNVLIWRGETTYFVDDVKKQN